jgi:predicted DNA-binding protein (UPF0251 family)/DNA-directed RNA polymerase subunit RPC12/RpoP
MGRPHRIRYVEGIPNFTYFQPRDESFQKGFEVVLTIAEFEALRLKHHEGKTQVECAELMHVSQPTFSRILDLAHKKITEALIHGKAIRIEGGSIGLKKFFIGYGCVTCLNEWKDPKASEENKKSVKCPKCKSERIYILKREIMQRDF